MKSISIIKQEYKLKSISINKQKYEFQKILILEIPPEYNWEKTKDKFVIYYLVVLMSYNTRMCVHETLN